jgi:hypothetical protein
VNPDHRGGGGASSIKGGGRVRRPIRSGVILSQNATLPMGARGAERTDYGVVVTTAPHGEVHPSVILCSRSSREGRISARARQRHKNSWATGRGALRLLRALRGAAAAHGVAGHSAAPTAPAALFHPLPSLA